MEYAEPEVIVVALDAADVIAESLQCDYETPETPIGHFVKRGQTPFAISQAPAPTPGRRNVTVPPSQ